MIEYPKLQPTFNNTYVLLEEYIYKHITVPAGYETNGASSPRISWSFVTPFKPANMIAILLHDYLTDEAILELDKVKRAELMDKADEIFYELMSQYNISKFERNIMYFFIRTYHLLRYTLISKIV